MEKVIFSPEDINQVESLAAGMSVEQVAHYFGIGKTTFYEIAKRQPELLERYKQGKAKRIAQYVSLVHDKILEGNVNLLKLYLRTQAGWTENRFEEEVTELPPIQLTVVKEY
jgi:transposase